MIGIFLTAEEMEVLIGLPSMAQRLYVFGIRPVMDLETGLSGASSRISWDGLAHRLSFPGQPGIKEEHVSKEQARRAAKHLVKNELITEHSKGKRLVFRCELAKLGRRSKNNQEIKPTPCKPYKHEEKHIVASIEDAKADSKKADSKPTGKPTGKPTVSRQVKPVTEQEINIPWLQKADTQADRSISIKPTHISDQCLPYRTVPTQTGRFLNITPSTPMEWVEFFSTHYKFQPHVAQTAKTIPLFANWCKRGISTTDVEIAADIAQAKIGKRPDSPVFYRSFVDEYLLEKQRAEETPPAASQNTKPGATHAARKPSRSKPMSAVERVSRANGIDPRTGKFLDEPTHGAALDQDDAVLWS